MDHDNYEFILIRRDNLYLFYTMSQREREWTLLRNIVCLRSIIRVLVLDWEFRHVRINVKQSTYFVWTKSVLYYYNIYRYLCNNCYVIYIFRLFLFKIENEIIFMMIVKYLNIYLLLFFFVNFLYTRIIHFASRQKFKKVAT